MIREENRSRYGHFHMAELWALRLFATDWFRPGDGWGVKSNGGRGTRPAQVLR